MKATGASDATQAPPAAEGALDLLHRCRVGKRTGAGRAAGTIDVALFRGVELNVDPTTEAPSPPRLALDEAEQRRLHDSLVRIAERTAETGSEEEVLTRIRNALAFLVEARMREMMREAREYELKALLTDLFGGRAAAATVERLNALMGTEVLDSP